MGMLNSTPMTGPSGVCVLPMRMGMPRNAACCLAVFISAKSGHEPVDVAVRVYSRRVSCEVISHLALSGACCRNREKMEEKISCRMFSSVCIS